MAHTYVIQSVRQSPATTGPDPIVTITGTVDGVPVAPTVPLSQYILNAASAISSLNFCVAQMLTAWTALQPTVPINAPAGGQTVTV